VRKVDDDRQTEYFIVIAIVPPLLMAHARLFPGKETTKETF
jgi:hypothetical protein